MLIPESADNRGGAFTKDKVVMGENGFIAAFEVGCNGKNYVADGFAFVLGANEDYRNNSTGGPMCYKTGDGYASVTNSMAVLFSTYTGDVEMYSNQEIVSSKYYSDIHAKKSGSIYVWIDYTVAYSTNTNAGTAKAVIAGKGNYAGTVTKTFTIKKANISGSIKLSKSSYTYNGKACKPGVSGIKGTYKVTYSSNVKAGVAKVTVTGTGNYTGTRTKTFKIAPKKMSIKKVTAGKKLFKVTWNKNTSNSGYQIQYSTKKNFSKASTKTVSGSKAASYTAKKLSSGKKYYVRIRAYKKVGSVKIYGGWSSAKTIKTK